MLLENVLLADEDSRSVGKQQQEKARDGEDRILLAAPAPGKGDQIQADDQERESTSGSQ